MHSHRLRGNTANVIRSGGTVLISMLYVCNLWAAQQQPGPTPAQGKSQAEPSPQTGAKGAPDSPAVSAEDARGKAWKCLTDELSDKDFDHRAQAVAALGTIGLRPDVVHLVEAGLNDKDSTVRESAAVTLGRMKSRSSIPNLRRALDDESVVVSFTAARALWSMGDRSGRSILIEVLEKDRKATPGTVHKQLQQFHEKLHDPAALAELGASTTGYILLQPHCRPRSDSGFRTR